MKKQTIMIILVGCLLNTLVLPSIITESNIVLSNTKGVLDDFDPLVDITVTVTILSIRALDEIDENSEPDFFVTMMLNNETYTSPVWNNSAYSYTCWNVTQDVPDDQEIVDILFCLIDWNSDGNNICDISKANNIGTQGYNVSIKYSIKTGRWFGGDSIGDSSGYGRLNGCDDGSIYQNERDCELWFTISQNDYDNDGLPFWIETQQYNTDPYADDRGRDIDMDGTPIEWEHKWGFDPMVWDDHENSDNDNDSINNMEEFLTESFLSDPFRKDLFLEIDFMNRESKGKLSMLSDNAIELLKNPFHQRNIVFHVETDDKIPFDEITDQEELLTTYQTYFKDNNESNWKRGVFHYGLFVHNCFPTGYSYAGDGPTFWGYLPGTNAFVVSATMMERYQLINPRVPLDFFHASVIMHEMGHNFGIRYGNPPGCDNQFTKYPWLPGWWIYRNYKSIMNYRYTYEILDYSDGAHGKRDFNDWLNINLSYFELPDTFEH